MLRSLHQGDYVTALAKARDFLATARYRDICTLVATAGNPHDRGRLLTLLRDVLCRYPRMRWGIPVLMHLTSPYGARKLETNQVPPEGIADYGWLPVVATLSPVFDGDYSQTALVCTNEPVAASLVLECDAEEPPTVPDQWLADLILQNVDDAKVLVMAPLPWPDAVEATSTLLAAASGHALPSRLFLGEEEWRRAGEAGREFEEMRGLGEMGEEDI